MTGKTTPFSYKLINLIAITNGLTLHDTLELAKKSTLIQFSSEEVLQLENFQELMCTHFLRGGQINNLLDHPVVKSLRYFLKNFPTPFIEEHTHLTGSLAPEFLYPMVKEELQGPRQSYHSEQLKNIYGHVPLIENHYDLHSLLTIKEDQFFDDYLKILYLPKIILTSRERHRQASYHMAKIHREKFNVGTLRLKFTLSRTSEPNDKRPLWEQVSSEDVLLGLYEGFRDYQKEDPHFKFILSPSFRKEHTFYNAKYKSKEEDFNAQVNELLKLLDKYPELEKHVTDVDTVGNERDLFRKEHFNIYKNGFSKLKFRGLFLRSHHGEVWHTLKRGIQAVDNAMNIWNIDTLEHGLSIGVNPNVYFQQFLERLIEKNRRGKNDFSAQDKNELLEINMAKYPDLKQKLMNGIQINAQEEKILVKIKFHAAREIEHYQHDVLNRLISKKISLVSLPTSNRKLTEHISENKDHPFTWWEKKGVNLGIGSDNYVTLGTNYINELLLILLTDPYNLKITKLLMVATGEHRRPVISRLLWEMKEKIFKELS
jgi:adenosine deaminase